MTKEDRDLLIENTTMTRQMHKALFGNGQPGALSRLDRVEVEVANMKRPKQWPAVVAALVAVVMMGISLWHGSQKVQVMKEYVEVEQEQGK